MTRHLPLVGSYVTACNSGSDAKSESLILVRGVRAFSLELAKIQSLDVIGELVVVQHIVPEIVRQPSVTNKQLNEIDAIR